MEGRAGPSAKHGKYRKYARLEELAGATGQSVSEWVRAILLGLTVCEERRRNRARRAAVAAFAVLALVLAAIGIYSVLSYSVRRRVREIGVRMALGAQTQQVVGLVVMQGLKMTFLGLAIGIAAALALGRVLTSLLFGVSAADLTTFVVVALLLGCIALLASVIPAYRATRVDPIRTLRDE